MRVLIPLVLALLVAAAAPLAGCSGGACKVKGDPGVPVGGAFALTDQAVVLERGRIVLSADSPSLLAHPERLERHLGLVSA